MKITISGATGLIGNALCDKLAAESGHEIVKLSRSYNKDTAHWDYKANTIDLESIEGSDAVIHLAGESIAGYWTENKKQEIENSRVEGTKFLTESITKLIHKPQTFICASAIGYYGDIGDEEVDESSAQGSGFLADVAIKWENEANTLKDHGIRVINLRIGLVLSDKGGALQPMLIPFKLGLGGKLGSGRHYMSWIMLEDVVGSIIFILNNTKINGPVNLTAPNPVTNEQFTKTLGKVLNRPTFLTVPALVLNTIAPDMSKEMLLASTRALPKKLTDNGFEFTYTDIEKAFKDLLK